MKGYFRTALAAVLLCLPAPAIGMDLYAPTPVPITELLRQCGTEGGFTVLCDPVAQQLMVSCRALDVEPREAFRILAAAFCLDVRRLGEIGGQETFAIRPAESIDRKGLAGLCRTRLLRYVTPKHAGAALTARFHNQLTLGIRGRGNSIVMVSKDPLVLTAADELLSHLDCPVARTEPRVSRESPPALVVR